jgi:hypothetical protein
MWLDDPRLDLLPTDSYYEGQTQEFSNPPVGKGLSKYIDNLPKSCELRRLDKNLIFRTEWGPDDVRVAGGVETWEKHTLAIV